MAGRLAKLAAAPIAETYKGKALIFSPLTLRQTATLKEFIRAQALVEYQAAKATLEAGHAPAKHMELLDSAFAFAARYPLQSELVDRSDEIATEWLRLALEARHPDLTLADLAAILDNRKERIRAIKAELDAQEDAAKNASRASTPAATTARTPRRSGSKPSAASAKPTAGPRRRSPR